MKHLSESNVLKRFSKPPDSSNKDPGGAISVFPNAPLEMPSETFNNSLIRRDQNRKTLLKWIQNNLKPDIDYGRIHLVEQCRFARTGSPHLCSEFSHWSLPMLFKSGAERIIGVLGLSAHFPALKELELACIHRQEITKIILKCELKANNGMVVAEGAGGRNIRDDNWNLNTSIKMAAKSALIDGVIRVAGLSGVFIKTHQHTLNKLPYRGIRPDKLTPQRHCNTMQDNPITAKQKQFIHKITGRKGMTTESLER